VQGAREGGGGSGRYAATAAAAAAERKSNSRQQTADRDSRQQTADKDAQRKSSMPRRRVAVVSAPAACLSACLPACLPPSPAPIACAASRAATQPNRACQSQAGPGPSSSHPWTSPLFRYRASDAPCPSYISSTVARCCQEATAAPSITTNADIAFASQTRFAHAQFPRNLHPPDPEHPILRDCRLHIASHGASSDKPPSSASRTSDDLQDPKSPILVVNGYCICIRQPSPHIASAHLAHLTHSDRSPSSNPTPAWPTRSEPPSNSST
jgi:hypothetical protein